MVCCVEKFVTSCCVFFLSSGDIFGNHVRAVFTLVLFIYIACVVTTVRSFREIPIDRLWSASSSQPYNQQQQQRIPKVLHILSIQSNGIHYTYFMLLQAYNVYEFPILDQCMFKYFGV